MVVKVSVGQLWLKRGTMQAAGGVTQSLAVRNFERTL